MNGLNMSEPRIEMNAVMLADGRILAVGGSVDDEDTDSLSLNADLFDLRSVNLSSNPPNLGTVSSAGANATERLYHSVALLLPDATVWLAGGNPERGTYNNTMEIYQPPYLFTSTGGLATRPSITSAPSSITYGNTFTVQTPNASSISSVVLVRNGTVTHAFGMDQRMVGMSFTAGSGSLTVTAPPNGNIAPPGYYMLFILNSSGVPSVAQMVQISPMVSSVVPNSGSTAGGTAVTITGTNFAAGATVTFGGTAATNVVAVNSTTITATTPAHAAGAVTVTVTVNGQSGSLANGFTYNGTGTISFSQVASATPSSAATVSVTYPAAQTAGDLNLVVVGWNDTTSTVQSVKDSGGNNYTLAIGPTKGTGLQQSIYYAANIVGGANTVTVTFNQAAADPDIRILEYRGVTTLDAKAGASGSSTAANSGAATTTSANELIFGADMVATTTGAAGSGFTSRIITSPDGDIAEDKVVTTAGSNSATATLDGSGPWVMQMVDVLGGFWSGADGEQCGAEQRVDGRRDGGDDHGDELCRGGDGDVRRYGGDQRGGSEQHDHHGHHPGTCGGSGNGDGDGERAKRKPGQCIYLPCTADGEQRVTEQRVNGGRDGGDDHGDELCRGGDGDVRRYGGDQRGGSEQHDHHRHHPGTCGGSGNGDGDRERAKRKPGQWVHL